MVGDDGGTSPAPCTKLEDLKVRVGRAGDGGSEGFCVCFWLLLRDSPPPPVTLLQQIKSDSETGIPFLVLRNNKELTLLPVLDFHYEAQPSSVLPSLIESPSTAVTSECSLDKWVHIGCEVNKTHLRLHINGAVAGSTTLSFTSNSVPDQDNFSGVTLAGNKGDGQIKGYIQNFQILPKPVLIADQLGKDPPLQLSLDLSSISEGIEECSDGVWSIVGGEVSCRRNFSLDVVLMDALGHPVNREIELFASLIYADDHTPVEKPKDEVDAPLLVNYDGLEIPSTERTVKLAHGRASFRLKIAQLSSKCDNRLFCILIKPTNAQTYSFIKAYSPPICCISRTHSNWASDSLGQKLTDRSPPTDGSQSQIASEGSPENVDTSESADLQTSNQCEPNSHSPKRLKIEQDESPPVVASNGNTQCNRMNGFCSHSLTTQEEGKSDGRSSEEKFGHHSEIDGMASDSESTDAMHTTFERAKNISNPIPDAIVFKYCLEGTFDRSRILKEIVKSATEQVIREFAEQVSVYAGCSHHWYPIMMARALLQEGVDLWNTISRNHRSASWVEAIPEIQRKFRKISCGRRGLLSQDIEILRRIAGCGEEMSLENFDKMWCWLYPVAFTLSIEHINKIWECLSPRWIEGLVTKDEAEHALGQARGIQKPGTFVLRFPTSRSWPHPDAGSLVATYVGVDYNLHNKILSIHDRNITTKPLQDLLLQEPELSQLARVRR